MFAIVSLLDTQADERVRAIHAQLMAECGLQGIRLFPYPHFSWLGGEWCHLEQVETITAQLAGAIAPLMVTTNGLGLFTGASPVVYIPVVKTAGMVEAQLKIWEEAHSYADKLHPYYAPEVWVPHITLALQDVKPGSLSCALERLSFQSNDMTIQVNNLALVFQDEDEIGRLGRVFPLNGTLRGPEGTQSVSE
jgi:2'-5' RNA ligase